MDCYCIKDGYTPRLKNRFFDDTPLKDEWQKEVYAKASEIADENNLRSVLDIGTGSAFKLLKYFGDLETLGMDLPRTVAWLRRKYPDRNWTDRFEPRSGFDLVICADVIEHVPDPDQVLNLIEQCRPRFAVISTPDRALLKRGLNGPPGNKAHVREWSFDEFAQYVGRRFALCEHFISNPEQSTQVVVTAFDRIAA
jgi:SAM-dependent methyltransferase